MSIFNNFEEVCKKKKISLAQAERLAYIDYKLRCFGEITRNDIMNEFKIASAAASKDLASYREIAPLNSHIDYSSKKTILNVDTLEPLFTIKPRTILHFLQYGFCRNELMASHPKIEIETINIKKNEIIETSSIEALSRAIYRNNAIKCVYYNSKNPESPKERILFPTKLFADKNNWYFRAYEKNNINDNGTFKNFKFNRTNNIQEIEKSSIILNKDEEWDTFISLHLTIHPKYPNKEYLREEYNLEGDDYIITCRAAWALFYRASLAIDVVGENSPNYYEFLLKNIEDLKKLEYAESLFK